MSATPQFDPRAVLARPDLAEAALEGVLNAGAYRALSAMRCVRPSTPMLDAPEGRQQDQLLFGEGFDVLEVSDGWAWGRNRRDGYVGYVTLDALGEGRGAPTHRVASPSSDLPLNALVEVVETRDGQSRIRNGGWMASGDLADLMTFTDDPVAVAETFLGAPYDWGGRRMQGIDCSGLVQAALFASGLGCPRDSDQQAVELGETVTDEARRGDVIFWPGHVAILTDATTVIHANGHHHAVTIEPLADVQARMSGPGERRRISL